MWQRRLDAANIIVVIGRSSVATIAHYSQRERETERRWRLAIVAECCRRCAAEFRVFEVVCVGGLWETPRPRKICVCHDCGIPNSSSWNGTVVYLQLSTIDVTSAARSFLAPKSSRVMWWWWPQFVICACVHVWWLRLCVTHVCYIRTSNRNGFTYACAGFAAGYTTTLSRVQCDAGKSSHKLPIPMRMGYGRIATNHHLL